MPNYQVIQSAHGLYQWVAPRQCRGVSGERLTADWNVDDETRHGAGIIDLCV